MERSSSGVRLPPELRLQVFSHLLRYPGELQRRTTLAAEGYKKGGDSIAPSRELVDTSLFVLCRTLHQEALDCFYTENSFKIHYNQLCICEARFRFPAFDHGRIKRLHIYEFCPRDALNVCPTCRQSGLGLISYLSRLPKLKACTVSFEDYLSVEDFVRAVQRQQGLNVDCSEVGRFLVISPSLTVQFQLSLLNLAWRRLAEGYGDGDEHSRATVPGGEESIRNVLEYLQFEAEDWKRVPLLLRPFFCIEKQGEGLTVAHLRLRSAPDSSQKIVEFTLALTEVLLDLFSDDLGSDSVEWEYLDGVVDAVSWDFREAVP